MKVSWLVLLVAVYVLLDVANPLMPGALMFGIEDSVEARQADRLRGHDDAALLLRSSAPLQLVGAERAVILGRAPAPVPSRVLQVRAPRSSPARPAPSASPEDH